MDNLIHRHHTKDFFWQDANSDPNVAKARDDPNNSNSASGLLSTLIPVLLTAVAMTTIFLILRRTQERQYAPRSYLGSLREQERSPPLPKTLFGWIPAINKVGEDRSSQLATTLNYFN
jgi:Late exocytosis, associated with Golgi transport